MTAAEATRIIRRNLSEQGISPKGRVQISRRHFGTFVIVNMDGADEWATLNGIDRRSDSFEVEAA